MKRSAINVCVANGPWQIIVLATAVHMAIEQALVSAREDHVLILYENKRDESLRRYMEMLAKGLFSWREVRWIPTTKEYLLPDDQWPYPVGRLVRQLRQVVGYHRCKRLWLCHLLGEVHQYFMEAYRSAEIFLYEDGLQTCVQSPVFRDSWRNHSFGSLLKWFLRGTFSNALASSRLDNWRVSCSNADRVRVSYIYATKGLGQPLPGNDYDTLLISEPGMKHTVLHARDISEKAGLLLQDIKPGIRTGLFVCQAFYLSEIITYEEELAVYRQVLQELAGLGWLQMDWKDHPKNPHPFLETLQEEVKTLRVAAFSGESFVPIELYAGINGYGGCFSASSTAMFTLNAVIGLPVYTVARQFVELLKPSAETVKLKIAQQCFTDYSEAISKTQKMDGL